MKDKLLLSKNFTDIFLGLAFQEGLLIADPNENDYIYEPYKNMIIDHNLAKSLLEQLLLSPKPILRNRFHESVKGLLIDNETFLYDDNNIDQILPLSQFSEEMFIGILRGHGIDLTSEQFNEFMGQALFIGKEYEKLENEFGGSLPNLGFKKLSSYVTNDFSYLNEEKYQRLIKANELAEISKSKLLPLYEFLELQTLAEKHNAMIKIPIKYNHMDFQISKVKITDNQTLILRLVEEEFNYISLRPTSLKDTIELSKRPEFVAYREKQDEWINKIIIGDYNDIKNIRREIRLAKKYIDKLPIIENGGNLLAYIGVPLSLVTLPISVGFGLAIAGIIPSMINEAINENYKWAMINKINM